MNAGNCFLQVDAIVFLVDAVDRDRFPESKRELDGLLSDEALAKVSSGAPLMHSGTAVIFASAAVPPKQCAVGRVADPGFLFSVLASFHSSQHCRLHSIQHDVVSDERLVDRSQTIRCPCRCHS